MSSQMNCWPFADVVQNMSDMAMKGYLTYLQFLCARCGMKQTSDTPNTVHQAGYVCEECKGTTTLEELKRNGINFLLVMKK